MDDTQFTANDKGEFPLDFMGCYTASDDPFRYLGSDIASANYDQLGLGALDEMTADAWLHIAQAPQAVGPPQPRLPVTEVPPSTDTASLHAAAPNIPAAFLAPPDAMTVTASSVPATDLRSTATSDDWARHRNVITRLYIGEKYTLAQVQAVMKEKHGFRASTKMYKDRFKKWGLQKNITGAEAEAIARMKVTRDIDGKPTQIFRGGQRLDEARVLRHLKRRGSAAEAARLVQTGRTGSSMLLASMIRLSTPPPPPLAAEEETEGAERFLFNARVWIDGNFDRGAWSVDPRSGAIRGNFPGRDKRAFSARAQFHALYFHACILNQGFGRDSQSRRYFDQVLNYFRLALMEEDPELLWELLYRLAPQASLASSCHIYRHAELEARLAEEACRVLNNDHPVAKVVEFLVKYAAKLDPSPARDLICAFSRSTSIHFQGRVGKLAPISLTMHRRSVRLVGDAIWPSRAGMEKIQREYLKVLSDVEAHPWEDKSSLSQFTAKTKLRLALALYSTGEGEEARRWAREASKVIHADEDPSRYSLFLLGLMEKNLGNRKASLAALFKEMGFRLRSSIETGIINTQLFVHPILSRRFVTERKTRCMDLAVTACSEWGLHDTALAIVNVRDLLLGALQSGTWNTSSVDIMRSPQMGALAACAAEYDNGKLGALVKEFL